MTHGTTDGATPVLGKGAQSKHVAAWLSDHGHLLVEGEVVAALYIARTLSPAVNRIVLTDRQFLATGASLRGEVAAVRAALPDLTDVVVVPKMTGPRLVLRVHDVAQPELTVQPKDVDGLVQLLAHLRAAAPHVVPHAVVPPTVVPPAAVPTVPPPSAPSTAAEPLLGRRATGATDDFPAPITAGRPTEQARREHDRIDREAETGARRLEQDETREAQRARAREDRVAERARRVAARSAERTADIEAGSPWPDVEVFGPVPRAVLWRTAASYARQDEKPWFVLNSGGGNGALVAFHDRLLIAKVGGLTSLVSGSLGGGRTTVFPFAQITGVEFNGGMVLGVLEVLTPSYSGTSNKDHWRGSTRSTNANSDNPATLSNTLPMSRTLHAQALPRLVELQQRITEAHRPQVTVTGSAPLGISEELGRLRDLHASGALDDDEYAAAKASVIRRPS